MDIQHDINAIGLTSSEISYLWTTYIMESKCRHIILQAIDSMDDTDIITIMKTSENISYQHMDWIKNVFKSIGHPIPKGFSEEDINKVAHKLFSDNLSMHILRSYTVFGLSNYGMGISLTARSDVRQFFTECLKTAIDLLNKIDEVLLNKGIFQRTPSIPIPEVEEFATSQSIMGSFMVKGRPLNCLEIGQIFNASRAACIGEALFTALAQVTANEKIKKYLTEGIEILKKHIHDLNSILTSENLTCPTGYVTEVLNTRDPVYSERLLLYFAVTTIADINSAYAYAKTVTVRKDVMVKLTEHSAKLEFFQKDGMDIMIDNGWYEEFPKNVNRKDIIELKQ